MKTPEEIIKEKYPCKDIELDGDSVIELMEQYANQYKQVKVESPVKPACETLPIIDEMLREADILKEHKDYVYNLDNAERLRGYKLALQRLKEKIMSKSV